MVVGPSPFDSAQGFGYGSPMEKIRRISRMDSRFRGNDSDEGMDSRFRGNDDWFIRGKDQEKSTPFDSAQGCGYDSPLGASDMARCSVLRIRCDYEK